MYITKVTPDMSYSGPAIDHIVTDQRLVGGRFDNAIIVVRDGFYSDGCLFDNCAFVCETADIAREVKGVLEKDCGSLGLGRVAVGGMNLAISMLSLLSAPKGASQ